MFAVIYRSYIKPEFEMEYQRLWNEIANYFIKYREATGAVDRIQPILHNYLLRHPHARQSTS
jgi:hypothetical protein